MSAPSLLREVEIKKAGARADRKLAGRAVLFRWLKFNFVGAIGIGVQFATLLLLKGVFHFNYLAATAIAVEAAVVHNFVWHEQFTWSDRVRSGWGRSIPRFVRFNLTIGALSTLGNLALMKVMVGSGGMNYLLRMGLPLHCARWRISW